MINKGIENVSRRNFIKLLGLGGSALVLGMNMPVSANKLDANIAHELNFFVSIDTAGEVTIVCHRSEMGQGIRTSVPQIIADELGATWDKVKVVQAKADRKYGSQGTAGSASIRSHFTTIRQMGAMARDMLEQAAANMWQVEKPAVKAQNHFVVHLTTGKKLSFAELAASAAKLPVPNSDSVKLKSAKEFSLIGKDVKQIDLDTIVAGKAQYAQDIQLPDMLIASIQRPPVVGGKVVSFDASAAKKIKGVVAVIKLKERTIPTSVLPLSGVAVLATNTWAALEGRKLLNIQWEHGDLAAHDSQEYHKGLKALVKTQGETVREKGNLSAHQFNQNNTIEATYSIPYLHHAPMETPAATAFVTEDKCIIWAGTQNPQWAQALVATELGYAKNETDKVELNVTLMGGAFGRKSKSDFILEAVELSSTVNKPVKVVWSREDDIQHGFYHSISANYCKAELIENGKVDNWILRNAYPPISWLWDVNAQTPSDDQLSLGFADIPFEINKLSIEKHKAASYVRPGWVRSVACINNGFALGSFVDELAVKAEITTKQMWLNLLGKDQLVDPTIEGFKYSNYNLDAKEHPIDTKRIKNLINYVTDKANADAKVPDNQGWGISFLRSFGSYVAAATKVLVKDNKLTILEMHTAVDCGTVITPDRVKAQMEGAMVFGLSIALMGEVSVKSGVIEQSNFHNHPVTRMNQVPELYVHLLHTDNPPGGIGEPGVPPIVPSITNAIYHASGIRIRDLPVNKVLTI